jgi:PAS domain S-box-containing protein
VLTQLVNAAELKVVFGYPGADFYIAPSVLFLPYLTIFMIVYVTEGTLMAQRLIIGAMATLGLYIYLSHLTALQCNWAGYTISQGPTADSMDYLLRQSQHTMAGTILAQTLDFFLIPIFFQRLRNLRCRMFFCIVGALMLTQIVDTFVYTSAVYWGEQQWWLHINSSYIAKAVATVWLSILATIYVLRIEKDIPGEGRGTLDIILAFFGSYGKAQTLQQHIREWEGRYRMVVENASDMILLLNHKGIILDANFAAIRIFKKRFRKDLLGQNFPELVFDRRNKPIDWGKYAPELPPEDTDDAAPNIQHLSCIARTEGTNVELDLAMTGINVQKQMMLIVFGRDVTEDNRLSREKEELREQLAHAQRLESIGKLAGGVAHDFNNYPG